MSSEALPPSYPVAEMSSLQELQTISKSMMQTIEISQGLVAKVEATNNLQERELKAITELKSAIDMQREAVKTQTRIQSIQWALKEIGGVTHSCPMVSKLISTKYYESKEGYAAISMHELVGEILLCFMRGEGRFIVGFIGDRKNPTKDAEEFRNSLAKVIRALLGVPPKLELQQGERWAIFYS